VIDAGIAIKWVIEEDDTSLALAVRRRSRLIAPELLVAECANILWKKVQRREIPKEYASLAAKLLQSADIAFLPTRHLLEAAVQIAIELEHPAYDCLYLALAIENDCRLVTADRRLLHKLDRVEAHRQRAISLSEVATP
jgi:predicted nucleic acid-binding protein